jgi:hypothetical protein
MGELDGAGLRESGDGLRGSRSRESWGRQLFRWEQPQELALGKFFREVGEEFGEEFAFAALRAANARQPDPGIRR